MKYTHPTITIDRPAPGHYIISGHAPQPVFLPDAGHLVPPRQCYISPEVPSDALQAVLDERAAESGDKSGSTKSGKGGRK